MTIPNLLTMMRILLTPFLVWLLLEHRLNQALVVFVVAGVTDGLDGFIARVFHQKSRLGAYLDPLADKLLLVSAFLLLGHLRLIPDWVVVIAVSRDVMILLGLMTLMFHQVPVQIKPVFVSKITTLMQLLTVFLTMGSNYVILPSWVYMSLFFITTFLTVLSGIHYILIGLSLLGAYRSNHSDA